MYLFRSDWHKMAQLALPALWVLAACSSEGPLSSEGRQLPVQDVGSPPGADPVDPEVDAAMPAVECADVPTCGPDRYGHQTESECEENFYDCTLVETCGGDLFCGACDEEQWPDQNLVRLPLKPFCESETCTDQATYEAHFECGDAEHWRSAGFEEGPWQHTWPHEASGPTHGWYLRQEGCGTVKWNHIDEYWPNGRWFRGGKLVGVLTSSDIVEPLDSYPCQGSDYEAGDVSFDCDDTTYGYCR